MSNNLSSNLKKIRKEHNLSQEDLADILGVSRQAISKWESNSAYPEMDKILQICKRFDVNINDLLNNDIVEVKKEEESKNSINKYIDSFLNYLTKTVNMFFSFNLKNKIKCLIEQCVIIFILFILFGITGLVLSTVIQNLISFLPTYLCSGILGLFETIYFLLAVIFSVIIFLHIFKIRYLDYYEIVKETKTTDNRDEIKQIDDVKSKTKLIIRDPKHSEYRFIKALLKINVDCIKILSLMVSIFFSFTLVCSVIALVSSFIIVKTGLFFVGTLVTLIGIIIVNILLLLMFINFTFNRKSDKKKFIYVFISGLVISGLGIGLTFIGSLGFNVVKDDEKLMKDGTIEIDMTDNLAIYPEFDYEFKEADINNVKIEYQVSKYCDVDQHNTVNIIGDYNLIYPISHCDNPMELLRGFIDKFNDKKIIDINSPIIDGSISNLTIYASKENIAKLKSNNDKYYEYETTLEDYENRIYMLEDKIRELEELNADLESTNQEYQEQIDYYENNNE